VQLRAAGLTGKLPESSAVASTLFRVSGKVNPRVEAEAMAGAALPPPPADSA